MGLEAANNIGELNPAWPLGSDPKAEGDDHIRLIKSVLQASWPIGRVWMSTNSDNPFVALGFGTWTQLAPGRILIGTGDNGDGIDRLVGEEGGEAAHLLTETEMPIHNHGAGSYRTGQAISSNTQTGGNSDRLNGNGGVVNTDILGISADTGGDQPHENMPPFHVVFQWERTA